MAANDLIQSLLTDTPCTTFCARQDFPPFTSTRVRVSALLVNAGHSVPRVTWPSAASRTPHGRDPLGGTPGSLWRHLRPVADIRSDCDRARREYVNRSDPRSRL